MSAETREHSEISPSSLNCMRPCPCFRGGLSSDVAETSESIREYFAKLVANEVYRRIFWKYMMEEEKEDDDGDREFHEPDAETCSRCRDPNCSHRVADYTED